MIIVPGIPPMQETRNSRELNKRVEEAIRDYRRDHPELTEAEVRAALMQSTPGADAPGVVRRKRVLAAAIAAVCVGAFTATASAGGSFTRPTWIMIGGVVAAVAAVAIAILRMAQRD
jgi:hypothetical protein